MRKSTKRLVIHRETVRALSEDGLSRAAGAIASAVCNTATCYDTCVCSGICTINTNSPTHACGN